MDHDTEIGLLVFGLGAALFAWIVRAVVRAVTARLPTPPTAPRRFAPPLRPGVRPLAAVRPPPAARTVLPPPPARSRPAAATPAVRPRARAAPPAPASLGLLGPFFGGPALLRSIVVAEALALPLGLRHDDPR